MRLKVLVADDNKLARMLIASALQRLHPEWELVEAPGADDALHAIITGTVDIALVEAVFQTKRKSLPAHRQV
jgi:CheY-like chemotaxis protein